MQKFILCMFFLLPLGYSNENILSLEFAQHFSSSLEQALAWDLERNSGRKNIVIKIKFQMQLKSIAFHLSQRHTRDTLFVLKISQRKSDWLVQGRVLKASERELTKFLLKKMWPHTKFLFSIAAGPIGWAIVKAPVADLYVQPKNKAGGNLASQLVAGIPIVLLQKETDFFHIQNCEDRYLGWIKSQDIRLLTKEQWQQWLSKPAFYLAKHIKSHPFVVGTRFSFVDIEKRNYLVKTPKGKLIKLPMEHFYVPMIKATQKQIIAIAKEFLPSGKLKIEKYLWGGTSIPQIDCSGFTQLTFRLNNVLLPRDSDQQYQYSIPVAQKELKGGDLIFFSKHGRHPTHVGIYLGEGQFIHCSASGPYSGVKINSLLGNTKYEQYLQKIYYGAGRILHSSK